MKSEPIQGVALRTSGRANGRVAATTVAVCVATYSRPEMLAKLLASLAGLKVNSQRATVIVVVVDNDAAGSAAPVVEAAEASFPWRLLYAIEPQRNIASARNAGVAIALGEGADFLAFVDDDEQVTPTWLTQLLLSQGEHEADIVGGSVLNIYGPGTPPWIVASGLPLRGRARNGRSMNVPATSNVLVARRVFAMVPAAFDERFGLSGGSDSHFFLRARLAGATTVWADEAIVHETMPRSRANVPWLLRRSFRVGNTAVLVARTELPIREWLPRRFVAACYRLLRGVTLLAPALFRGRAEVVLAFQDMSIGLGALAGIAGLRVTEYHRTHGA